MLEENNRRLYVIIIEYTLIIIEKYTFRSKFSSNLITN